MVQMQRYENGEYTFHWDYDENVKEVEIYDVELSEELGESLPCERLCLV